MVINKTTRSIPEYPEYQDVINLLADILEEQELGQEDRDMVARWLLEEGLMYESLVGLPEEELLEQGFRENSRLLDSLQVHHQSPDQMMEQMLKDEERILPEMIRWLLPMQYD